MFNCCHIGSGMLNLLIIVEDSVTLSGQVCNKNIEASFIACDFSVKRVVTFEVVHVL